MRTLMALALLCAGCGGGLERASFVTDALSYTPGARVGLRLTNVSTGALGVNLCLSQLVSADGKTTGPSEAASCAVLTSEMLPAGEFVEARKTIPGGLAVGKWRYATTLTLGNGAAEKLLTPEFDLGP